MSLDDLKAALAQGTQRVASGRIRVDARKALEKLRDHRLADPHHYVLELLRAAVASGATTAQVRVDSDDFELRFDGAVLAPPVLRDLLSHALTGGGDPEMVAARFLALGVAGALGLDPAYVRVVSPDLTFEVRPPVTVEFEDKGAATPGTFVHVRERVSWRVVRDAVLGPTELGVIRRAVRKFPAKLTVNGESFARESVFDVPVLAEVETKVEGVTVVAAVPRERSARSALTLEVYGVEVTTRRFALPFLQVVAWARDDSLRRNASGSDVVDGDARLVAIQAAVERLALDLLRELVKQLGQKDVPEAREMLASLALELVRAGKLKKLAQPTLDLFEKAPILPGPSGEWVSVGEFRAESNRGRQLRFARTPFPAGSYTRPALLMAPNPDLELLLPMRPRVDVASEVAARRVAAERRIAWEAHSPEPALLPEGAYACRARFEADKLAGEVGLGTADWGARVRLLSMGKLVQQTEVSELDPLPVLAVVDLKRTLSEKAWMQSPVPLDTGGVLDAVRNAATHAVCDALKSGVEPPADLRAAGRAVVTHWAKREAAPRLSALLEPLRTAPLFETAGGAWISLEALLAQPVCRYTTRRWPNPSLNGFPVVVLRGPEEAAVTALAAAAKRKVRNYGANLAREAEVRAQMTGRGQKPVLKGAYLAVVPVVGEGLGGEVGVPLEASGGLSLTLLMSGFPLEHATFSARYDVAAAVVDCPDLSADEQWRHAKRDEVLERVLAAVRTAERELALALVRKVAVAGLEGLHPGPLRFVLAVLRKELDGFRRRTELDELQRVGAGAKLFRGPEGRVSLREIADALGTSDRLGCVAEPPPGRAPAGSFFVVADGATAAVLSEVLEVKVEDFSAELASALARAEFLERPQRTLALAEHVTLAAPVEVPHVRGLVGYDPTVVEDAEVELLYEGRYLMTMKVAAPLPLRGTLEIVDRPLDLTPTAEDPKLAELLERAIGFGEERLVERALDAPEAPLAMEFLYRALGAHLDKFLSDEARGRLQKAELLPCTDGARRPARVFDAAARIPVVSEVVEGTFLSGEPVIAASTPGVHWVLPRWKDAWVDVTEALRAEIDGRHRHEGTAPVDKVTVTSSHVLRRVPFVVDDVEGEVALVSSGGGRVSLLKSRRFLCINVDASLPPTIFAAANCDALTPRSSYTAVVQDAAYEELVKVCGRQTEALAKHLTNEYGTSSAEERTALTEPLANLAIWLLVRKRAPAELLELPLLEKSDGAPLSLQDLVNEQRRYKRVRASTHSGSPLAAERWVWRPRPGEREALTRGSFKLEDGTLDLTQAAAVRSRPKVAELRAPIESPWREAIAAGAVLGEVALAPNGPLKRLTIAVHFERARLETFEVDHPVGGIAQVNSDALKPTRAWDKAVRNEQFRDLRGAVDSALERLVARVLATGGPGPGWMKYALAAASWKLGEGGPIGEVLPSLPLFEDLEGRPVTLGQVLAEKARAGRISIAEPGVEAVSSSSGLVLSGGPEVVSCLDELGLKHEDLTVEIRRHHDLEAAMKARRLSSLSFTGSALVRLGVDAGGFQGELVLPLEPELAGGLVLARAGVRVGGFDDGGLGVAGVLDHAEMPVSDDWTEARPTAAMRRVVADQIDLLFGRLAELDDRLAPAERRLAAGYVLRFLDAHGVSAPSHLDALPAGIWRLASCKLFWTCDGRWVDLRSIAGRVLRRGRVAMVNESIRQVEVAGDVVLRTESLDGRDREALEKVLGRGALSRMTLGVWRAGRTEEDPEEGSPLQEGLQKLRRESRLLKAGSLGRLTGDELKEIKLQRKGGKVPIRYDATRQMAALDPEHPLVKAALEESVRRPDRIYVLLAAIYGAVNRALERITDEDERRLVSGLVGHLAANPNLLEVPAPVRPE